MVPTAKVGCAAGPAKVGTPLRGGGVIPSASVGCSEDGTGDRGGNVGASDPKPSGTSVGASDGGGRSDGELPGALDGERTAAPPSACLNGSLSRRNRPCSPMSSCVAMRKTDFSQRGKPGLAVPPQPPAREDKSIYPENIAVSGT